MTLEKKKPQAPNNFLVHILVISDDADVNDKHSKFKKILAEHYRKEREAECNDSGSTNNKEFFDLLEDSNDENLSIIYNSIKTERENLAN